MSETNARKPREPWSRRARGGAWAIVGCGVLLRVIRWAHDQSLYADALGADLVGRTVAHAGVPLEFVAPEPVGYVFLVSLVVDIAGLSESALRLIPLLSGCAALALLVPILRRVLPPRGGLVALALVALAWRMIDYSALSKPYMTDVLAAVALLLAGLRLRESPASMRRCGELTVVGMLAVLCSFPSAFVLCGIAVGLSGVVRRRTAALVVAVWSATFALHYWGVIAGQWDDTWAERVWGHRFAPVPPATVEQWLWYPRHVVGAFTLLFSRPDAAVAGTLAFVVAVAGAVSLTRHDRRLVLVLVVPFGMALIASAVHVYPFAHRHLFFMVPAWALLIGAGFDRAGRFRAGRALALVIAAALLLPNAAKAAYTAVRPPPKQDMRALVEELATRRRAGDLVYVLPAARPAFHFYARTRRDNALADATVIDAATLPRGGGTSVEALLAAHSGERVWLVRVDPGPTSLVEADEVLAALLGGQSELDEIRYANVSAHLIELRR